MAVPVVEPLAELVEGSGVDCRKAAPPKRTLSSRVPGAPLNALEVSMKRLIALAASLSIALPSLAQSTNAEGEITKIDKAQAKITLRHGEIKSLDMPAMTMVYRVRDAKLLDSVAVGDRVRFAAEKVGGNFTVTSLSKAP
jgi:Cu(I)/Ag(I) efflux system periplasmic protein CusF